MAVGFTDPAKGREPTAENGHPKRSVGGALKVRTKGLPRTFRHPLNPAGHETAAKRPEVRCQTEKANFRQVSLRFSAAVERLLCRDFGLRYLKAKYGGETLLRTAGPASREGPARDSVGCPVTQLSDGQSPHRPRPLQS